MRSIIDTSKGIGLRSEHIDELCTYPKHKDIDFLELAPENWMNIGGQRRESLKQIAERYPLIAHGLTLSIGDGQPLNREFIQQVARFLNEFNIDMYSDHLSMSRDKQGYLYDLLPIPRRKKNISYLVDRIQCVQDIIQRPLILENISYYHDYGDEIPEGDFFSEIINRSDCKLLLDINNIYVNSHNQSYCPYEMLRALPSDSIAYYHIAGHLKDDNNFLLDTHGKSVQEEVVELAKYTFELHGCKPLLLERDNNLPPLNELTEELCTIHGNILNQQHGLNKTSKGDYYA